MGNDVLPVRIHSLTDIQKRYLNDYTHRFFVLPPGRRSRKTLLSSRKVLLQAMKNPGHRYFQGAPTRQQAKAIFWDRIKKETKPFWLKDPSETDLIVTLLNGTELHVVGLDKPQRIEGQPWHGCHISEFDDTKPGCWEANIRPVLSDTNGWAIIDGVPEGRDKIYDLALYACNGAIPKTLPGVGAFSECESDPEWCYYHWFSSDVLPAKEIEAAKRSMDEKTFRQEYEGSFEGFDGLAYYAFSQANIIDDIPIAKDREIVVGMDFNYDPMCSVIIQDHAIGGRVVPVIVDAFAFRNCDTNAACERIIDHCGADNNFTIYPDPACNSRSAHGAAKTDITLIRQAFSHAKAFQIRVKTAHPKRKDRLNAVNTRLKNAAGDIGLYVCKRARAIIGDLQRVTTEEYLNGNFTDPMLGHSSDALGYFIDYKYPITGQGRLGGQTF